MFFQTDVAVEETGRCSEKKKNERVRYYWVMWV